MYTSSTSSSQSTLADVEITCTNECAKSVTSAKFTITQSPGVCTPATTGGKNVLTGLAYNSLPIKVGMKVPVIYNTASYFFNFASAATCTLPVLQKASFTYSDSQITVDSTNDVTSINVADPSTFFTTTNGVPTKTFDVTYAYWKSGDTTSNSGTLTSNKFTVTQDCTQQPYAEATATNPASIKFAISQLPAKGGAPTYTILSKITDQFVNSNCWALNKAAPKCTVNNVNSTATDSVNNAKFAIIQNAKTSTTPYDYTVTATLAANAGDLSAKWNADFTVTCVSGTSKATASSTTKTLTFTYNGCSSGTTALALASTYATGTSTLLKYTESKTAQSAFTIIGTAVAANTLFYQTGGYCPDVVCSMPGNTNKGLTLNFDQNKVESTSNSLTVVDVAKLPFINVWCKNPKQAYFTIQ